MSDIFREVDEDLRHEQYKRLWDRFGTYVILLAILIVVATAGWRLWEYWQLKQAEATGSRFVAALSLAEKGDHQAALDAFRAIEADGSGRYPILARFRAATERAATGDVTGAVADFDAIASSADTPALLQDLAKLRAATLLADTASLADMQGRISSLAETGNPWRHSARELLGLVAWRTGDLEVARDYYEEILEDQERPPELQSRAQFMVALIRGRIGEPAPAPASQPQG